MPVDDLLTRRRFLQSASITTALWSRIAPAALAGIAQSACSARQDDAPWRVLAEDDAADFAAMAARIIPTTDTPGAAEAGVVHFFDQALAGELADSLPFLRTELATVNARLGRRFATLDAASQDAELQSIETSRFFALVRVLTLYGFFAMSSYGGNSDHVAWKLIGFDGHHGAWEYPFGFYDAQVHVDPQASLSDGD